jgi:hypothetical protein
MGMGMGMASRLEIMEIAKPIILPAEGHPMIFSHERASSPQTPPDSESEDALSGLLELLTNVPESRKRRGLVFPLAFILAAALIAILGGLFKTPDCT